MNARAARHPLQFELEESKNFPAQGKKHEMFFKSKTAMVHNKATAEHDFQSEDKSTQPELSQLTMSQDSASLRSSASSRRKHFFPPLHQNSSVSSGSNPSSRSSSRPFLVGRESFFMRRAPLQSATAACLAPAAPKNPYATCEPTILDECQDPKHRSSGSVSTFHSSNNRIETSGPAQRLLRMTGTRNIKSYANNYPMPSSHTARMGMANTALANRNPISCMHENIQHGLPDQHAGITNVQPGIHEQPSTPNPIAMEYKKGVESISMHGQEQHLQQFYTQLEALCEEKVKMIEGKLEEKFKRMVETEFSATIVRMNNLEDAQAHLKATVTENNNKVHTIKYEFEDRFDTVANEIRSKELEIESGIQDIDTKLTEMRESVADHSQALEKATETHLEMISKSASSSIQTIKDLAETSSASLFKRYEELRGMLSSITQVPLIQKVIDSTCTRGGQSCSTDFQPIPSPLQETNDIYLSQSKSTTTRSSRTTNDTTTIDKETTGVAVSSADRIPLDQIQNTASQPSCSKAKRKRKKSTYIEKETVGANRSATHRYSLRKRMKKITYTELEKDSISSSSLSSQPNKPCVTPSGEKIQQFVTPPPTNKGGQVQPCFGSTSSKVFAEGGKENTPQNSIQASTDADVIPLEIVTGNSECPSPLGNASARIVQPEIIRRRIPIKPKLGRRKRRKKIQTFGKRSSMATMMKQEDSLLSFSKLW